MATPVLAGNTLAQVAQRDGYTETIEYRGGRTKTANGTVITDLVQTSAKRKFKLAWTALTDAQRTTLLSAVDAIKNTSGSFTAPTGSSYTVTMDDDQPDVNFDGYTVGNGTTRWRCELYLREV